MGYNLKKASSENNGKSFDPLPSDRYNFKVVKAQHGPSKHSSNYKIELTLQVMDGKFKNRKVWHNLSMSPKALSFITRTLTAMGKESLLEKEDVSGAEIASSMTGGCFSAMADPKTLPQSGSKVTEVDSTTIQKPTIDTSVDEVPQAAAANSQQLAENAQAAVEDDLWE